MDTDQSLREFGLVPADEALPTIRAILADEADAERTGRPRADDLALLCCVQLFSRGLLEDVLRIWDAKQSGFDLGCYLGVQLLCGAGLAQTKEFLANSTDAQSRDALSYIQQCELSGDFDVFTPESYLAEQRRYFGA